MADQSHDLARADLQVEAVERRDLPEAPGELGRPEQHGHGSRPAR
jgi:hypothetical protein